MAYIQDKAKRWLAEAGADKIGSMIRDGKQANLALVAAIAACDVADGVIGGLSDVYQPKGTIPAPTEPLCETAKWYIKHLAVPCDDGLVSKISETDEADEIISELRKRGLKNPPTPVRTYREDFFEKFPKWRKDASGYPLGLATVALAYGVSSDKQTEYARSEWKAEWDRPLGYWEKP